MNLDLQKKHEKQKNLIFKTDDNTNDLSNTNNTHLLSMTDNKKLRKGSTEV